MTQVGGTDPAVIRHMLGDGMEIDEAGVLTKIPNADIRKVDSTTCLVHRDHLSTVKLGADAVGGIGLRQRFAPYGERTRPSRPLPMAAGNVRYRQHVEKSRQSDTGPIAASTALISAPGLSIRLR
ncbi:MAG: hypothetical protein ABS35_21080 [Kaistia sp. SCN 65-12]|nr:MAG: hypothetical protein ABS35_21080 [Kaistia sp. SCN 65-12]